MKTTRSSTLIPLAVLIAFSLPAAAQKDAGQQGASPDFAALEAAQNAQRTMIALGISNAAASNNSGQGGTGTQ